jgi:predicted transposase YbfD/YdcC
LNRGRTEARCVVAFDVTATRISFPFAEQAGRLTRCTDSPRKPAEAIETEYLISSRSAAQMNAEQMLRQDRDYWGIETGLHLRLDVIAGEDRSRVRHPVALMNLAVIRRAVVSLAIVWSRKQTNPRQATMSGFYDFMSANNSRAALKLANPSKHVRLSKL